MRWVTMLAALLAAPVLLTAQSRIMTVEPDTAKVGATASATGEGMDKSKVAKIYLTDGKNDILLPILEQTEKLIRFRVPDKTKPGRYALMIETKGADPKLMEQPVKINIE